MHPVKFLSRGRGGRLWWPARAGLLIQFEIIINVLETLALSASMEYLCYWSTTIINILILSVRGLSLDVRI